MSEKTKTAADKAKQAAAKQHDHLEEAAHKAEAFIEQRAGKVRSRIAGIRRHGGGDAA